jgi:hypothetical protein
MRKEGRKERKRESLWSQIREYGCIKREAVVVVVFVSLAAFGDYITFCVN